MERVLVGSDPWQQIAAAIEAYMRFAQEYPELWTLVFERPVPGFEPSTESMEISRTTLSRGQEIMQGFIDSGQMRPGLSAEQATDFLDAVMHGLAAAHMANEPVLDMTDIRNIPALTHDEATSMACTERDHLLSLLESLSADDWERPTRCSRWNVRQSVAHLTGAAAGYAHFSEFRRQGSGKVQRPYRERGFSKLDAQNQIQVDDRADTPPARSRVRRRPGQDVGPAWVHVRYHPHARYVDAPTRHFP